MSFDELRTASLPKLLWGTLLTVGLSLLAHLLFYLLEDLFPSHLLSIADERAVPS